ncbi:MAG TPA: hypothetical protein VK636_14440, partial [Gemmatimonadaceae bacterium]|nr:hypothetical protein [Gemmatimonadaceae bacterium]
MHLHGRVQRAWALSLALPLALVSLASASPLRAQRPPVTTDDPLASIPKLASLVNRPASEMTEVIDRFAADQSSLNRRYDASESPAQRKRMHAFYAGWRTRLAEVEFEKLGQEGRVDYVLLDNYLTHQVALLDRQDKMRAEVAVLMPFADRLLALQDTRRNLLTIDPRTSARAIADVTKQVDSLRALFEVPAGRGGGGAAMAANDSGRPRATAPKVTKTVANRGADNIDQIRGVVSNWYRYYDGYDPMFSWWMKDPYRKIDEALTRYSRTLRERVVGFRPADAQQIAAAGGGRAGGGAGGAGGGGGGRGGG